MHLGLALQTAEIRLRDFVSPPDDDMPVTLIDKEQIRMLVDQLRSARRSEGKVQPRIVSRPILFRCPLYPQKRTCAVQLGMSALGQ